MKTSHFNPAVAATAAPPAEPQSLRIELFEHPSRPDLRGIEFHFPTKPSEDIKAILEKAGFKFLPRRNGLWEPRYYKVQSAEAWQFAQWFTLTYSPLFGEALEIDPEDIPPEFRNQEQLNPEISPNPAMVPLQPAPMPDPVPVPVPEPEPAIPPGQTEFIRGIFRDYLTTPDSRIGMNDIILDVFGVPQGDSVSIQRFASVVKQLIAECEIVEIEKDIFALPSAQAHQAPQAEAQPQDDPPTTMNQPTQSEAPQAESPQTEAPKGDGLDLFSWIDDLVGMADEAVAEAESRAQAALWRPEWSGGLYRWFKVHLGIATHVMESALAVGQCAQEISASKKVAPSEPNPQTASTRARIQPEMPSVALADTPELPEAKAPAPVPNPVPIAPPPLPVAQPQEPPAAPPATPPAVPSTEAAPKKTRRAKAPAAPKAISRHPRISGEPIFLDDDELPETERFIGCYAELNGMIGLSFKGLLSQVTFSTLHGEYTAMPGTFQPLEMADHAHERMRSLLRVWDAYSQLIEAETAVGAPDEFVDECRTQLNVRYDDFVARHGTLTLNSNLTRFHGKTDNRLNLLLSLEREDRDTGEIQKADIFSQRLSHPVLSEGDQCYFDEDLGERCYKALMRCLDIRGGSLDLELIAQLTGLEQVEVEYELLSAGHIRRDPIIPDGHGQRGSF